MNDVKHLQKKDIYKYKTENGLKGDYRLIQTTLGLVFKHIKY